MEVFSTKMNLTLIQDTPQFHYWAKIEPLDSGWSLLHKFKVTDYRGDTFLVKVSDIATQDQRRGEFNNFKRLYALGLPVSRPVAFGRCNGGRSVYMLLGWVKGYAVEDAIHNFSPRAQYQLGVNAGLLLKKIHDYSHITATTSWESTFATNIQNITRDYFGTKVSIPKETAIFHYINQHKYLLKHRPQVITHGDYHWGNLIITPDATLGVIDCDTCHPGDPWVEFSSIVWAARLSPQFARGQVDGYFNHRPSATFFKTLALYIGVYALDHVVHSLRHGTSPDAIKANTDFMATMFSNFTSPTPSWYTI